MPSGAEFDEETNAGMRPILPGSGQEFSVALGGNRIREQFTGKFNNLRLKLFTDFSCNFDT